MGLQSGRMEEVKAVRSRLMGEACRSPDTMVMPRPWELPRTTAWVCVTLMAFVTTKGHKDVQCLGYHW